MLLQVALSGVLAGVIGFQRYRRGRPAGLRTHAVVAMASACFTFAGTMAFGSSEPHDPTRIAAQVAGLNSESERDALRWIEAVSEFDTDEPR